MPIADEYPLLNLIWTMLVFFGFVIWLTLLFRAIGDLFTRHDIGGWHKFFWFLLMLLIPLFGVLIYLVSQGHGMAERAAKQMKDAQKQFDDHVREVAGDSTAQIAKAKELLDSGAIDQAEYDRLKEKALQ